MKKRVLLLGNHGFVIYNFRKELIKKLLKDGYEVFISLPNDEKVKEMVSWGCKFIETNVDRRGTNPIRDASLLIHYLKILRKIKPDVVLCYTIKPNIYGGIASRILSIPCINNITGLGSGFNKGTILRKVLTILYKISLKKSYCVFFQNKEDLKTLVNNKIIKTYYELIPGSGVNINEFEYHNYPDDSIIRFLFIGRIMKDKGIEEYLKAAETIKYKYPNTEFIVIGFVESTHTEYVNLINSYENKGYIKYYGYQKDVKPFLKEAHCLIQPSHGGEGLSNVLLEAAATGRPLIASDIPGCRETIEVAKNGYLFQPKESKSLVNEIEKFINLKYEEKISMGKYSRVKVEKEYNRNIVINAYMEKIDRVCQ